MRLTKQTRPSLLNAKNILRCTCTRITTCPSLSFRVIMSKQEVRGEKKRAEPSWTAQPPTVRVCGSSLATEDCDDDSEQTTESSRKTPKLEWPIAYYTMIKKKKRLFYLLLHILFLLDTIDAFIDFLVCMYVIFIFSTISFGIIRLGIAALFIILQLILLLLAISLFANVELQLPEFFCEGTMQPLSVFLKSVVSAHVYT